MGKSPFTMPGSEFLGKGNQSVSPGKYTESPAKDLTPEEKKQQAYVKMSKKYEDEPGFKEARDKAFGGETIVEGSTSKTVSTPPKEDEEKETA